MALFLVMASTAVTFVLTMTLLPNAAVTEKNPITAFIIGDIGWTATAVMVFGVAIVAFQIFRILDWRGYHAPVRAGLWSLTALNVLNAANDVWVAYLAPGFHMNLETNAVPLGVAVLMIGLAFLIDLYPTEDLDARARVRIQLPSRDTVMSISMSVLMVTSLFAMVAVGGGLFAGSAAADSDSGEVDDVDDVYYKITDQYGDSDHVDLIAVDKETGDEVFRQESVYQDQSWPYESKLDGESEALYVPTGDGYVYAFDATDGTEIWESPVKADETYNSIQTVAVSPDGGTVLAGASGDETMYEIDAVTGDVVSEHDLSHAMDGEWIDGLSYSPDGTSVVVQSRYGDHSYASVEAGTWDLEWKDENNYDDGGGSASYSADGEKVVGSYGSLVKVFDADTGDVIVEYDLETDSETSDIDDADRVTFSSDGGSVYAAGDASDGDGGHFVGIEVDTGEREWYQPTPGELWSWGAGMGHHEDRAILSFEDGTVVSYGDDDDGVEELETHEFDLSGSIASGELTTHSLSGGETISGSVVNQYGEPVDDDIYVEWYGVNVDELSGVDEDDERELRERSREILQEASEWDTDELGFDENLDPESDVFDEADGKYIAIHEEGDWGLTGYTDSTDLGQPLAVAPADEDFIISVWNADRSGYDGLSRQLPGRPVDDDMEGWEIELEQLDYTGDTVQTHTITPNAQYDQLVGTDADLARVNLPAGFYRVDRDGQSPYVIAVGDPEDLTEAIASDIRDDADQLTDRADWIKSQLDDERMFRGSTTVEDGTFELDVPSNVHVASVQAHGSGTGELLETVEDPDELSVTDTMDLLDDPERNGTVYMSGSPERVEPPAENVEVQVAEIDSSPFTDPGVHQNRTEWLQDLFQNESFVDELVGHLEIENDEKYLEQIEELAEQNDELAEQYEELIDETSSTEEQIAALEQTIADLESELVSEDPDIGIEDDEVSATVPFTDGSLFGGSLDDDSAVVTAHYPTLGESETVPDEYVSVESSSTGPDEVHIDDFPLPEDASMVTFSVSVSGADGGLGNAKIPALNPSFTGQALELDSVEASTLHPGPDERVTLTPHESDDSVLIQSVNATVEGPNGPVEAEQTDGGDAVRFQTDGAGSHQVTLEVTDVDGGEWTERFNIRAKNERVSEPATVMVREGFTGTFALVGEPFVGGEVQTDGDGVSIVPIVLEGDTPSSVHVHAHELSSSVGDTEVRVMEELPKGVQQVNRNLKVYLHTGTLDEDAIAYRNGNQPLEVGGGTAYGDINCNSEGTGCTVVSHTDADGSATFSINENPDFIDRMIYWARSNIPVMIGMAVTVTSELPALADTPSVTLDAPVADLTSTLNTELTA
ncbi:outer membrane protein assembly factor BamB family protein [Natrialbaceae archaeon A-gly3]